MRQGKTGKQERLVIIGAGNIGTSVANGLAAAGFLKPARIVLCDIQAAKLEPLRAQGFATSTSNTAPLRDAAIVLVAVEPQHGDAVLRELAPSLVPDCHTVISVMAGITLAHLRSHLGEHVPLVRAMPNTALTIRTSMTCLAADRQAPAPIERARALFSALGETLVLREEQMSAATALGASGIAFFMRAIRAAMEAGVEIGFTPHDAQRLAAQAAKGAASLLQVPGRHPESEIDRVTTPRGCTIAGLNQLEQAGFSSALIKCILAANRRAEEMAVRN